MAKSKTSWGRWVGLTLVCGGVLAGLPWVLNRSNWDNNWTRPAMTPLWKVQARKYGFGKLVISRDGSKVLSIDKNLVRRWSVTTGKELPPIRFATGFPRIIAESGDFAVVEQRGVLLRTVSVAFWSKKYQAVPLGAISIRAERLRGGQRTVVRQQLWGKRAIEVWNLETGKRLNTIPVRDDAPKDLIDLRFADKVLSPDGTRLFLRFRHEYQMWDVAKARLLWQRINRKDYDYNPALIFSPDIKTMYAATSLGRTFGPFVSELRLINKRTDNIEQTYEVKNSELWPLGYWRPVVFSPDARYLIAVKRSTQNGYVPGSRNNDGRVYCWDVRTKKLLWTWRQDNFNPTQASFSADSNVLALGGIQYVTERLSPTKGRLVLLQPQRGELLSELTEESPSDLFQQANRGRARNWANRLRSSPPTYPSPYEPGDSGDVTSLAFSPDGKKLAASYRDGELKMWRVP